MTAPRLLFALLLAAAIFAAAPATAQQLYWLDTKFAAPTLNRCNPDGTGQYSLALPVGSLPEGLVVDPVSRALYWTEATFTGARVRRCNLDLSFPTDVVTGGSALRGLAVDPPGGRLFWTASNTVTGPLIRRSNVDGTAVTTIGALAGAMNPRGLAYSALPAPASLYMCDLASDALYRYDTNGTGGPILGLSAGTLPYGIAVDGANNRVFYTEYRLGRVMRCTATGGSRTQLVGGLTNPTHLALDVPGNRMYWVEGGSGTQRVMRADLNGGSVVNLGLPVTTYGGIAFAPASLVTGVDGEPAPELALGAVSPNPAFGQARVDYALPRAGVVRLSIFDLQGREVALIEDGVRPAGRHAAALDAAGLGAGLYFVRMRAQGATFTRRLVLVR